MTEFKVGDEIQFDETAVREADRLDKDEFGGMRGYAEGIIRKGGLESGGVIERSDYSDEAPFQIKLPNGSKCWAEEEWLKMPDKFQPGDVVNWQYPDGRTRANGYWDGSVIIERCTTAAYEDYYKVRREDDSEGVIHGDDLVLVTSQEDDYDEWKANDSAEYYHSGDNSADSPDDCECGCDSSPDEAPVFRDYKPVVDEVQDDKVWAALTSLPADIQPAKPYQIHMIPKVKDPAAPTVEELSKGIDVSAHITDISDFSTTFTLGTWEEPELVDHPAHYGGEDDPYEVIKVIEAWDLDFHLGNAIKYIPRAGKKDPETEIQDLEKAAWYINRKINILKEANGE